MKNFLLLCCVLFNAIPVSGQQLNTHVNYIKDNYPTEYKNTILNYAIKEWGEDYEMIVYTINNQADALYELVNVFKSENTSIAYNAITEWSYDGYEAFNKKEFQNLEVFEVKQLIRLHCDWTMVKYVYDNQVKAKSAF